MEIDDLLGGPDSREHESLSVTGSFDKYISVRLLTEEALISRCTETMEYYC